MKQDLSKKCMQMIKHKAQSTGVTQIKLAKKLGVSLPTIKRWYGGGTITLESLSLLAKEVGLSLTEVFSSIEKTNSPVFQYTEEQDYFFSLNLDYLAYFDNLLRGYTAIQIQKKFKISNRKTVQYLSQLDKLNLIKWLPKNKVQLLKTGEPAWKPGGPLSLKMKNDIIQSFLKNEIVKDSHFFLHDYLPQDKEELLNKLQDIIELAKQANNRAKHNIVNSKPAGLYLSLQNFRWDIDKYLV